MAVDELLLLCLLLRPIVHRFASIGIKESEQLRVAHDVDENQEFSEFQTKVGCAYPMVVVSIAPHAGFGPNDYREDEP